MYSYEHLNRFLQAPTGQIMKAPLQRTRTGHLVLDRKANPTNLTILQEKAEVFSSQVKPLAFWSFSPHRGAIAALLPDKGTDPVPDANSVPAKEGTPSSGVAVPLPVVSEAGVPEHVRHVEHVSDECERLCVLPPRVHDHGDLQPAPHQHVHERRALHGHTACASEERSLLVLAAHDQVVSSLPHRIRSLRLRLADHRLRSQASAAHGEGAPEGPSLTGWPCKGAHKEGAERGNQ